MTARSQSWQLRILILGTLGCTLLGGCEPYSPGEDEPTLAVRESGIKIANSLSTQALVFNGISTNARANSLVRTSALGSLFNNTSTEDGNFIRDQLTDPNARQFMKYLVSCALSPSQALAWQSSGGHGGSWAGSAGLCTQWLSSAPTESCLRQVSACILARNNAVNRRVELSLRGQNPNGTAFSLAAQPLLVEFAPDVPSSDEPIQSFKTCLSRSTGTDRDCGWSRDYIGSCTPGSWVRLGAGSPAKNTAGSCTGPLLGSSPDPQAVLRVCSGIVGCNKGGTRFLANSTGSCSSSQKPSVAFTCPASGFFNVMKAPWDSSLELGKMSVAVETTPENNALYRIPEAQAFPFREGAFYGNLFTEGVLTEVTVTPDRINGGDGTRTVSNSLVTGSVYPNMYACHDPAWSQGAAYASHRVCALPGTNANCAATAVGSCQTVAAGCATYDASPVQGDGDYDDCKDLNNNVWSEPVTVFLNGPCDVMPANEPLLCKRSHP